MFTGIIQDVGKLSRIERSGAAARIWIETNLDTADFQLGESIAIDGVCLTVAETKGSEFRADVSSESLSRSTLTDAAPGRKVNVERAMRASDRFGGHFVLGHVDGVGRITGNRREGDYLRLSVKPPAGILKYIVEKGSIAINGISLTVNTVEHDSFSLMLIPTTLDETNLADARPGEMVNIETDVVGKYVEKFVNAGSDGITLDKLKSQGWD